MGAADSPLKDTDEVSWGLFPPQDKELKSERKVGRRARDVSAHTNVKAQFFSLFRSSQGANEIAYAYGVEKINNDGDLSKEKLW